MNSNSKYGIKYAKYIGLAALAAFAVSIVIQGLAGSLVCGAIGFVLGCYIPEAVEREIENEN